MDDNEGIRADEESADDQAQDENGIFWGDPREKPRTGATIIQSECGRLDIELFPPLLMEYAGMHKPDATRACASEGGLLVDNVDCDVAETLAEVLKAHGEDCFVVPAADVIPLPRERQTHAARLTPSDLGPVDAAGRVEAAPWEKAIALAMGQVAVVDTRVKSADGVLSHRLSAATRMGGVGVVAAGIGSSPGRKTTVKRSRSQVLMDIVFLGKLRRYRIESREFDYKILGDQRQPGSEANIRALARCFLRAAPGMRTNFDAKRLMATGAASIPRYSECDFDETVHWLINMVRFEGAQEVGPK